MNDLDNLLSSIQEQCDDAALDMFGPSTTARWKNPCFAEIMQHPDAEGEMHGVCGDIIKIFLRIKDGIISRATFYTSGCGASIVSGDMACELAMNKTVDQASEIGGEDILKALGGLPDDKTHCAHLASSSLQEALGSWLEKSR